MLGPVADPVIRLDSDRVSVEPGGQAQVGVTILNPGSIVEGYRLDVVGEGPSTWAEVTPAEISVYPQAEAKAFVTFHPPGGNAAPSGTSPFGVRVRSTVDADASAVAEGDVEIGKVFGLQAKIVPVTSSGRWRGRHTLQLSNWGNAPAKLRVVASDPDEALGFYVRPDVVELPLGGTGIARVSVRTRKPFLRGNRVRLPFQIVAERADTGPDIAPPLPYADPTRPVVDGAFNQKPILSKAVVALLGLVLVAGLGLGAYAMFFLKSPTDPGLGGAGPPTKPVLSVETKGPDAVLVSWEPIDGVETYRLFSVDPESKTALGQDNIQAGQNGKLVEKLQPVTTYCYQLSAVRGGLEGPLSDEKCTRTEQPLPGTKTPSPGGATTAGPSGTAPPSPGASGPPVSGAPPTVGQPPGQQPTQPGGSLPPGASSAPVPSASVPGATAPPGGGPFAGGRWVAVADLAPEGAAAQPRMAATAAKLASIQPPPQILRSADYPNMKGAIQPTGPVLMVAVGPFDTPDQAQALCPQIKAATGDPICLLFQPQP
jgi:hypothetical protein